MGKYMKKSRTTGEIAIEIVSQTALGVKTRARSKTLALQSQNNSLSPPSPSLTPAGDRGDGSYLQLRSRRLDKPSEMTSKRQKKAVEETCAVSAGIKEITDGDTAEKAIDDENFMDSGIRASFGENVSDIEDEEDVTATKSTANDLMMKPETLRSPDTNTAPDNSLVSINPGTQGLSRGLLPTKHEVDEFFACAEEELHKEFIKKYNFDPVNEKPLPGRYQWERVNH